MAYSVKTLKDVCIGAASCVAVAPDAFDLDNEGKVLTKTTINNTADEVLLSAAKSCPVNAIIISDETGKQIWPK